MDRISALRNIEDALQAYEDGEVSLTELECRVGTVLGTYATEFEDESAGAYRARGPDAVDGTVVVADGRGAARSRVRDLVGVDEDLEFELEHLG